MDAYSRASAYDVDDIRKNANLILEIVGRGYLFLEVTKNYVYIMYAEGKDLASTIKKIVSLIECDIFVNVPTESQLRLYKKAGFSVNSYTLSKKADKNNG